VVIAIILILAAILFPAFARAKRFAERTPDVSNMKQLYEALIMYRSDYNDAYPVTYNLIRPYTSSDAIFASNLDDGRVKLKDGKWVAVPFYYCEGKDVLQESDFKMSYGYLRNIYPTGSEELFNLREDDPTVGLFADPYAGDEGAFMGLPSNELSMCGQSLAAITGSYVTGPVLRIQTDGSLYVYSNCDVPGFYGESDCLFFTK